MTQSAAVRPPHDLHPRQAGEHGRIQALTDGVFAIAMTLLVLDLKLPAVADAGLGDALRAMVPRLLVYFLTMLVLGGLWFRHRTEFLYLTRVDRPLIWLNLAVLALVALAPWSASLAGQHHNSSLAVAVFNVNMVMAWLLQQAGWLYATGRQRLVGSMSPRLVRASRIVGFVSVVDFTVAAASAWFSPVAALVIDLAAPLMYVTGASWWLLHRLSR